MFGSKRFSHFIVAVRRHRHIICTDYFLVLAATRHCQCIAVGICLWNLNSSNTGTGVWLLDCVPTLCSQLRSTRSTNDTKSIAKPQSATCIERVDIILASCGPRSFNFFSFVELFTHFSNFVDTEFGFVHFFVCCFVGNFEFFFWVKSFSNIFYRFFFCDFELYGECVFLSNVLIIFVLLFIKNSLHFNEI